MSGDCVCVDCAQDLCIAAIAYLVSILQMSPPRKASTSAPSRKGSISGAPVKHTITVIAKSKVTASKAQASDQDDGICPECELLVDEDSKAIAYDVCSKWFHTTCQNISDALYTVLTSEETANVSWYCNYCNYCTRGAKNMMLKILKLNDRQEKVENGLNVIVKLHENLEGDRHGNLVRHTAKNFQRQPGSNGSEVDREDRTDVNTCSRWRHMILRDAS